MGTPFTHTTWQVEARPRGRVRRALARVGRSGATGRGSERTGAAAPRRREPRDVRQLRPVGDDRARSARWRGESRLPRAGRARSRSSCEQLRAADARTGRRDLSRPVRPLRSPVAVETAPWAGHPRGRGARPRRRASPRAGRARRRSRTSSTPRCAAALEARGVHELYEHQAEAWAAAQRGEHVVVVTGTASGKSLAFNLPVLDALAARAEAARALPLPDEGARPGPAPLADRR